MPPIFSTFIRYGSRSSSTTTQLPTEFLAFFSLISSPCGARPGTGLAEPAERPRRERSDRSGLGAVRRVTAQQAPVAAEADRLRAAGATELDSPGRRYALAGAVRLCGGAGWLTECGTRRLAGAWSWSADHGRRDAERRRFAAARRDERPWREAPAYAARISRRANMDNGYEGSSHTTVLLRACI